MGSVGFEASVHIPQTKNTTFKIKKQQYGYNKDTMRDLYHRKDRLNYWINRIDLDLKEPDRSDVLKLVEHMQERERAILWIIRCITALISLRKQLDKSFRDANKQDIKSLLKWMDDEQQYKASTIEKYRQVLKLFYKIVFGNNEYYPKCVKWFSVKVGKERSGKIPNMEMSEYLEEVEVQKLIEAAPTLQKKAFLACLYESGARPEEFLRLSNLDIKIDTYGAVLILRGKTGERRVRIVSFAKLLEQWLEIHPLKDKKQYPLWVSSATNFKNQPLGLRGAQKIIEDAIPKAGISNKHARLYILRHTRASILARYLTEAQMSTFFGWVQGTQVVKRYIHMSGKDLDNTLLSISEGKQITQEDYILKTKKCNRCTETLSPTQQYCGRCGLSIEISEQYNKEMNLERENKELRQQIENIHNEMNDKFDKILSMIQENPKLSQVKPEVLIEKK